MKSFQQFIAEATYDPDIQGRSQISKSHEGGRIDRKRKQTDAEKKRVKAIGGGKTAPAKTYKDKSDIGVPNRKRSPAGRQQQPTQDKGVKLSAREQQKRNDVILLRIEQLYPFPVKSLVKEIKPFAKNAKFYWCQEEPKNMGAWFSVRDYIQWTLETIKAKNNNISYIGRNPDASPATGYAKRHMVEQEEIIKKVFDNE